MSQKQKKRFRRYHKDIFFPEYTEKYLIAFLKDIRACGSLTFSLHAVEKIVEYSFEYGKTLFKFLIKSVRAKSLDINKIFEFYVENLAIEYVSKACFRYSFDGFPVDIVLVISADGVVITMYVANKEDNHETMDKNLYERS